ncbi:MAG: RHS repeat domain-containing protein [Thermodesulfobacteriota bacterium]
MRTKYINQIVLTLFSLLLLSSSAGTATAQYTYDNLDRLIKVQYDDGTVIQYTYDAVGNRLTQQVQAFSGAAAASAPAGTQVNAPASPATAAPGSSSQETAVFLGGSAGFAVTGPAWPALLTRIRLAGSAGELEDLQGEIQNFLSQSGFSPEDQDRYQKEVDQELEARADFIRRTAAAAGEKTATESTSGKPREQKATAAPPHNKIRQDQEKIYTADPEPEVEKPRP